MTEAEWLSSTNPLAMLAYLQGRGLASQRKLRLLAAACCRRLAGWLTDERSRHAVEVAERYADGLADLAELQAAHEAAALARDAGVQAVWDQRGADFTAFRLQWEDTQAAHAAVGWTSWDTAYRTHRWMCAASNADALRGAVREAAAAVNRAGAGETQAQAELVRDLYGNPFRPVSPISPALQAWNGGCIPTTARRVYEKREFEFLPYLADLLQEAGCQDEKVLGHLRAPTAHVSGCWALDWVLAKQ